MIYLPMLILFAAFARVPVAAAKPPKLYDLQGVAVELEENGCMTDLLSLGGRTRLEDEEAIVAVTWNVENVLRRPGKFVDAGVEPRGERRLERQTEGEKTLVLPGWKFEAKQRQILGAAQALGLNKDILPHFLILPEVESAEAAERLLTTGLLEGRYREIFPPTNDPRGLSVAIGLRADLDVVVEARTHRFAKWWDPHEERLALLFTRDCGIFILRDPETLDVLQIIISQHGKSMRHRAKLKDQFSEDLRRAQYAATREITRALKAEFGRDVPRLMGGDFNAFVPDAPELEPLHQEYTEVFRELNVPVRVTQTYHPEDEPMVASQLDAFFVSESIRKYLLRALVLPVKDRVTGGRRSKPLSLDERTHEFSSDHRPIAVSYRGEALRRWRECKTWSPFDPPSCVKVRPRVAKTYDSP